MAEASTSTISIADPSTSILRLPVHLLYPFFQSVLELGGIERATPEAVLHQLNAIDSGENPLTTDDIAYHLFTPFKQYTKFEILKPWPAHLHCKFVDVVLELGGVDRASVEAVLDALIAANPDSDEYSKSEPSKAEVAHRLLKFRSSFKKFELRGLGFPSRAFLKLLNPNPDVEDWSSYGAVCRKTCSARSRSTPYTKPPTALPPPPPRRFRWTLFSHRRFVDAVEQLGGVETAAPGAILKRMKTEEAEGLTVERVERYLRELKKLLEEGEEEKLAKKDDGSHGYGTRIRYAAAPYSGGYRYDSFKHLVNDLGELSLASEEENAFSP